MSAVTINEIAKLANVSRATVDKVIHNRPGVKQETRDRVQAILDNVNYHPSLVGKALVLSKNPIIIGVIPTLTITRLFKRCSAASRKPRRNFPPSALKWKYACPPPWSPRNC